MTEKKYQVFISSTYRDLRAEREVLERLVLHGGDLPIGMEAFPAADEEQFEFIKSIIDTSDFYVLVIAGKYGTIAPSGLSYTEMEYDYAVSNGVPVLAFAHEYPEKLPVEKSEADRERRDLLSSFIRKVSEKRLRNNWSTLENLQLGVVQALNHAKRTKTRPGWIRGDSSATPEVMNRLLETLQENKSLKSQLELAMSSLIDFNPAGLETPIELHGLFTSDRRPWRRSTTFQEIFKLIAPRFIEPYVASPIRSMIAQQFGYKDGVLTEQSLYDIRLQFEALGLVKVSQFGATTLWELTKRGKQEILALRVLREPFEAAT